MKMENIVEKEELSMLFSPPSPNDVVYGKVLGQERLALFVDLGHVGIGIVYGREFFKAKKLMGGIDVGEEVKAKVIDVDGRDGYIEISITKALEEVAWAELTQLKGDRVPFDVTITKANKGGLIADVKGIQGFIPVSHLRPENYPKVEGGDSSRILSILQEFVGQKMKVVVLNMDPSEDSLILSEKEANVEEMKELLEKYEKGDIVKGIITGVVEFGAFIKFPHPSEEGDEPIEGLIHISELDWRLIDDPRDVVKEEDVVEAKVIDISKGRISLSLKALKEDPWTKLSYDKGDVVKGSVTKFNDFGAFIEIAPNVQGLIHISEFGTEEEMRAQIQADKEYSFTVDLVDPKEHRMILKLAKDGKK